MLERQPGIESNRDLNIKASLPFNSETDMPIEEAAELYGVSAATLKTIAEKSFPDKIFKRETDKGEIVCVDKSVVENKKNKEANQKGKLPSYVEWVNQDQMKSAFEFRRKPMLDNEGRCPHGKLEREKCDACSKIIYDQLRREENGEDGGYGGYESRWDEEYWHFRESTDDAEEENNYFSSVVELFAAYHTEKNKNKITPEKEKDFQEYCQSKEFLEFAGRELAKEIKQTEKFYFPFSKSAPVLSERLSYPIDAFLLTEKELASNLEANKEVKKALKEQGIKTLNDWLSDVKTKR